MSVSIRDYDRVADRIRQHRQADTRPVVVVEGPTDARFLRAGFDDKYVVFPCGTRSTALDATAQLVAWGIEGAACVVDRDFDSVVTEREAEGLPVFAYENADLEAMISQTDAFHLMVLEIGSEKKIKDAGGPRALVRTVQEIVVSVARLRAANCRNGWGLAFDQVDLSSKVSLRSLSFNLSGYCAALRQATQDSPPLGTLISVADGTTPIRPEPSCPRRSSPYYRGRDFLAAAGVGLRHQFGSCQKAATDPEHLAGVLRAIASKSVRDSEWGKDFERFIEGLHKNRTARIPRPR